MNHFPIKKGIPSWPDTEKPRELLLKNGPEGLTDAQLLAILLRIGRPDSSAVGCSQGFAGQIRRTSWVS